MWVVIGTWWFLTYLQAGFGPSWVKTLKTRPNTILACNIPILVLYSFGGFLYVFLLNCATIQKNPSKSEVTKHRLTGGKLVCY